MRLTPANLISGSYSDDALSWAAMRTVNWLPEVAEVEGTRTVKKLATPPGLSLLVDLGTLAPVRGIADVEGRLFAVSGDSLFEVSNDLAVTNRGSIPGVGRVSMAHNKQGGASAANELAIANGLSGYVYNTDSTVLSQITDSAFEGASTFDYVDGYMSYTDPQGRWWGHSDLNQATQYSSIDRNDAESAPDPIISHIVSHREVIVWGTRTGEFFRNTGAATGTFQRVDGTEMEVGICSTFARARVDNTVCWVGNDLTVYRLNGHAPQRISTRPIEQALSRVDPANVFCFAWEDRGHKVFYVTSPGDFTLGFDFSSGIWHERQTYGLDRWRVNCLARWGNRWIAGDYANGLLYELDWDAYMEHGLPMVSITTSGYTTADQNKVLCPYAELIFDTGGAESEQVNETALGLSGDVPDGIVTDSGTATYTASGGFVPYSFSIVSGELPGGAVMDGATGVVSYTYTTSGSFSWTVRVTDAAGNTDDLPDTAEIAPIPPVLWSHGAGITQKTDVIGGASSSNTDVGNPVMMEVFTARETNRVAVADGAGVSLFNAGLPSAAITAPILVHAAAGMGGQLGGVKGQGDVDQATGDMFLCRWGGDSVVHVKPDDTIVEITGITNPNQIIAIGSGKFVVTSYDAGTVLFYGPSNAYASPLDTIPDLFALNRLAFDSAGRRIFASDDANSEMVVIDVDAATYTTYNTGNRSGDFIDYAAPSDRVALTTPYGGAGNYGKIFIFDPDAALVDTVDYNAILAPDVIPTTAQDTAIIGDVLAVLQNWDPAVGSNYFALHLIDIPTATVVHTHVFAGVSSVITVTADAREGVFFVGNANNADILSVLAVSPFTETTITTDNTDNRVVAWL